MGQNLAVQIQNPGGSQAAFNVTAAAVVKSGPGTLMRIIPSTVGTAGNLTVNDNNNASSGNAAANQIASIPYGNMTPGVPITLEFPCKTGITVSAVPTGFVGSITYF